MFDPLNVNQRRRLLRWSVATSATAILLVPLAALPGPAFSNGAHTAPAIRVPDVPEKLSYPTLNVRNDPFALPSDPPVAGDDADPGFVLPPNDGIASAPVVEAVVLGTDPKALVEIDGRTRIVGIGTRLGPLPIAAITEQGVTLADGERLPLDTGRP